VCHFLYLIIFVPYNLFKQFLAHKISAYNYIYENGKKKWRKEKGKGIPACWVGGRFWPTRARARTRAWQAAHTAHPRGRRWGIASWCRPTRQRGNGGSTARSDEEGGGGGRSTGARPPVKFHGGSPSWVRFCGGGAMARHGRG
jgi:hypothetical protein